MECKLVRSRETARTLLTDTIEQFLRIESEHLGNVDGFRVTRDVVRDPFSFAADQEHRC